MDDGMCQKGTSRHLIFAHPALFHHDLFHGSIAQMCNDSFNLATLHFESIIWFQNVGAATKILWKCYSNDNKLAFFSQEHLILRENTLLFEWEIVSLQSEIFAIIPTKIKPISICKAL